MITTTNSAKGLKLIKESCMSLTLIFAFFAQIELTFYKNLNEGLLFYFISFLFIIPALLTGRDSMLPKAGHVQYEAAFDSKSFLRIISFVLFTFVLYRSFRLKDDIFTMIVWLICLLLFVFSFIRFEGILKNLRDRIKNIKPVDLIICGGILLLASVLRLYHLGSIPLSINQEEGFASLGAMDVINGKLTGPFDFGPKSGFGWTYYSGLYFFGHALFIKLFGFNVVGNRMFAAIAGILLTVAAMALAKELFNKRTAYIAGLLAAVSGIGIHFSRFGFPFIHNALWGAITLYFLINSDKKRKPVFFALSGIAAGISQYTWSASRILPVIAVCFFIYKCIQEREYLKRFYLHLSIFIIGFIMALLPLVVPFANKLPNFLEGAKRDFIFGGLMSEIENKALTLANCLRILGDYITRALLAFNFLKDNGYCYGGPGPVLPFATSVFFAIGLFYLIVKWKKPSSMLILLTFFGTMIFLVAITTYPPNYQRMVVILSLPPIIAASGISMIFDFFSKNKRTIKVIMTAFMVLLLSYLGWENYNDYFNVFTKYQANNIDQTTKVGFYIEKAEPDYRIYIPDAPMHTPWILDFMLPAHDSVRYMTLDETLNQLNKNKGQKAVVILMGPDADKAPLIAGSFPDGKLKDLPGDRFVKIFIFDAAVQNR